MLKINATVMLVILEFLFLSIGAFVFLFITHKKRASEEAQNREEIEKLKTYSKKLENEHSETSRLFQDLNKRFALIRDINLALKGKIASLLSNVEKSEEYEQLISELEKNSKEIGTCINSIKMDIKIPERGPSSLNNTAGGFSAKVKDSVSKAEFKRVSAEKKRLELRQEQLVEKLKNKTEEYDKLDKDYRWLEKEYNSLYNNISENSSS